MAGPWERYQGQGPVAAPVVGGSGPWSAYQPQLNPMTDPRHVRNSQDVGDAILAGMQASSGGLIARGEAPSVQLSPEAPWHHRTAAALSGLLGDVPAMIAGGFGGGAVGAPGGPVAAVTAAAGAFAVPMALREGLMEAYTHNYATSWEGIWEIGKAGLVGGAKGAAIGAVTAGAGRLVAPLLPAAKTMIGRTGVGTAKFATELTALTTASSAVEGRMPTAQDFMDNAILLAGVKLSLKTAQGLRKAYSETGKTPEQVRIEAEGSGAIRDAILKGELPADYLKLSLEQRVEAAIKTDARPEILKDMLLDNKPAELSKPEMFGDPVAYEYVSDSATLRGILPAVEAMYVGEIAKQTRGVVSNTKSAADGLRLAVDGETAAHIIGTAENAAQIVARKHLLVGASQRAHAALRALSDTPVKDQTPMMKLRAVAELDRLAVFVAEFRGARAEAGRALQIFNALKHDADAFRSADKMIELYQTTKGTPIEALAKMTGALKDPSQMMKFASGLDKATTMEMVYEAWKASILSGPWTHMANIIGNTGRFLVDATMVKPLDATMQAAVAFAKGDPMKFAQWKAKALAPWIGLQLGAKDGLVMTWETLKHSGEHFEKTEQYKEAIPGKLGTVIRTPFRALQAMDAFFRTPAERGKAYELAVDRAVKDGLDPRTAEFKESVAKYMDEPGLGLSPTKGAKVLKEIEQAGHEAVFTERLGPKLESFSKMIQGTWGEFVIPFRRTPINLVSWAMQHTPGLNLMSGRWRADFAAGGARRTQAIARVVVGTGITAAAFGMVEDGMITGGGMFEQEQGKTKRAAGWQPYSVRIGDKYYSYQRLEPVGKMIGLAADLHEMIKKSNDPEAKAKMASMAVLMFGNAMISTTYLSGLANLMRALTDPERYGESWNEGYASSLVPKIIGQSAQMIDPYQREVHGGLDAIQAQFPWLREKLVPKKDVWGENVVADKLFTILPVQTSVASENEVKKQAMRLEIALKDAPRNFMESGPFKRSEMSAELTEEQRDVWRGESGKFAMKVLSPIVNSPSWAHMPEYAKIEVFAKVFKAAGKIALSKAVPHDAPARLELREKILNRIRAEAAAAAGSVK